MPILSRYEIQATNRDDLVVVGWDPHFGSFFFQLLHAAEPEDPPIEWYGASVRELSLERCLELVARHAAVPDYLETALRKDKERFPFDPDRPARAFILRRQDESK